MKTKRQKIYTLSLSRKQNEESKGINLFGLLIFFAFWEHGSTKHGPKLVQGVCSQFASERAAAFGLPVYSLNRAKKQLKTCLFPTIMGSC